MAGLDQLGNYISFLVKATLPHPKLIEQFFSQNFMECHRNIIRFKRFKPLNVCK
jgi:hypothetical protein